MTNKELLLKTKEIVKIEKKYTHLVLKHLGEIERRLAYAELGYSSLLKYCVAELGYSEAEAWMRIGAMRLMRKDKKIEEKIAKNELSLTNASKIQTASRKEKMSSAQTLELVQESCQKSTREVIKIIEKKSEVPVAKKNVRLGVSCARKIERAKKILGDYRDEEIFEMLLDRLLREPKRKSNGAAKVGRYIAKEMRDDIFKRAGHTCEYKNCDEKRFLQVDHIIPYAKGGLNELSNLRVLCSTHNQLARVQCFGKQVNL